MEKLFGKRAVALSLAMGFALAAFVGLFAVGVDLPADFTIVVGDESGNLEDKIGYVGDDFVFLVDAQPFIDASDYMNVSDNLTATLTIGLSTPLEADMSFWDTSDVGGSIVWMYTWTADVAGTFDYSVNITDNGNSSNYLVAEGQITVLPVVAFNTGFDDTIEIEEDAAEAFTWNLTDAFTPAGLTYTITWPDELDAVMIDDYVYNITPAVDNFNGEVTVVINATDSYVGYMEHNFTVTITPVNDPPEIEYLMMDDTQLDIELWNYTWVDETEGNMSEWRNVVNISGEEEVPISFMVSAMDVETPMMNLTYEIDNLGGPFEAAQDLNETNMTIPYNFTVTFEENEYGDFWATLNVSDGELYQEIWLYFMIENVNDAPTGEWGDSYQAEFNIKTGEEVNVSLANLADVDGDTVSIIWKIDGTAVTLDTDYFLYNWSDAGTYNVSAEITDGTETVAIGYFMVNVEVANTAPSIISVHAYPADLENAGAVDIAEFVLKGEVEEGTDVELTCTATDAEGDELTYTWTNDQDSSWTGNGATLIVPGDYFQKGLSYTFTCTVDDGTETVSQDSNTIKIVEKEDEADNILATILIILAIIVGLVILLIIILVVLKGKKKEEPAPEEPGMGEEMPAEAGEAPMEGGEMPPEGMEQPMEEQPVPPEEPAPEQPVPEQPAPEEPVPEQPVPEQPAPEEPVPEQPAPEQPPMPPQPPAPPQ